MGLTIHYTFTAPATWSSNKCLQVLGKLREFSETLEPLNLSPIFDLVGPAAIKEAQEAHKEQYSWFLGCMGRHVANPWQPGSSQGQKPNRFMGFEVYLTDGSEPISVALASYPKLVWKAGSLKGKKYGEEHVYPTLPYFDMLLQKGSRRLNETERQAKKNFRDYLRKHKLVKCGKTLSRGDRTPWFGNYMGLHRDSGTHFRLATGGGGPLVEAFTVSNYISHRQGRVDPQVRLVMYDTSRFRELTYVFRFSCPREEALKILASEEFKQDTRDIALGKDHVIPADRWSYGHFTKTQYASNPNCGGVANFLRAHLGVVAILDKAKELGFGVEVYDEGNYWEKRDVKALAEEVGEWNVMIGAFTGALKDALGGGAVQVESEITKFPNFEQLEFKGMQSGKLADVCKSFKAIAEKIKESVPAGKEQE